MAQRDVRRKDCTLVTVDHNIPTASRKDFKSASTFIKEADSRLQCVTLEENVQKFGLTYFGMTDKRQGIVHVRAYTSPHHSRRLLDTAQLFP